jgi:hypothetical protein
MLKYLAMAAAFLMLVGPALAQSRGGAGGGRHPRADAAKASAPKVDEKAYKAALDSIPVPKQPSDPWRNAR